MTNEGVFPKPDGAILYGSEATRFASAGRFFLHGSTANFASGPNNSFGTFGVNTGSILIPAGSLLSPFETYYLDFTISTNGPTVTPYFVLSGCTANNVFVAVAPGQYIRGTYRMNFVSGVRTYVDVISMADGITTAPAGWSTSTGPSNVGSNYVVFLQVGSYSSTGSAGFSSLALRSEGRGY